MNKKRKRYKTAYDEFLFYFQLLLALLLVTSAEYSYQATAIILLGLTAFAMLGYYYSLYKVSKKAAKYLGRTAGLTVLGFYLYDLYIRFTIGSHSPFAMCGMAIAIQIMYYYWDESSRIFKEEHLAAAEQ